jgi:hypothetical protein
MCGNLGVWEMGFGVEICWLNGCSKKMKKCIPHWLTIFKILEGG